MADSKPAKRVGKLLDEFRANHDKSYIVPKKITDGLKLLGDGWEYEAQFARICDLSLQDLVKYRDQFEDHFVVIPGHNPKRVWAGTKATAQKMSEMVRG